LTKFLKRANIWFSLSKFIYSNLQITIEKKGGIMTKSKNSRRLVEQKSVVDSFTKKMIDITKKSDSYPVETETIKAASKITVDYNKTGKNLIEALKFDHVGPDIVGAIDADQQVWSDEIIVYPAQFFKEVKSSESDDKGDPQIKKVIRCVSTKKALHYLEEQSKRPCTIREGLEYIKANPWWVTQRYCIALLGTIVTINGRPHAGFLFTWLSKPDTHKGIYFLPCESNFSENTLFLAVNQPKDFVNEKSI
jgi:hypothetical protein